MSVVCLFSSRVFLPPLPSASLLVDRSFLQRPSHFSIIPTLTHVSFSTHHNIKGSDASTPLMASKPVNPTVLLQGRDRRSSIPRPTSTYPFSKPLPLTPGPSRLGVVSHGGSRLPKSITTNSITTTAYKSHSCSPKRNRRTEYMVPQRQLLGPLGPPIPKPSSISTSSSFSSIPRHSPTKAHTPSNRGSGMSIHGTVNSSPTGAMNRTEREKTKPEARGDYTRQSIPVGNNPLNQGNRYAQNASRQHEQETARIRRQPTPGPLASRVIAPHSALNAELPRARRRAGTVNELQCVKPPGAPFPILNGPSLMHKHPAQGGGTPSIQESPSAASLPPIGCEIGEDPRLVMIITGWCCEVVVDFSLDLFSPPDFVLSWQAFNTYRQAET